MIPIGALAVCLGALSSALAVALLDLISLCTNLFFYQRWSILPASPAQNALGPWVIVVPVIGALLVGIIARYGTDRIRGHGIPEAIEAILLRQSKVDLRVAILKPISAAIAIGSGGPFGAEGPIIMTGGAFGSLVAQLFHLTASERKTLLVAGAAAGMAAVFGTPLSATLLAVELLLFEWKPRSFIPVAMASATAAALRPSLLGDGPLFPVPHHAHLIGGSGFAACLVAGLAAGGLSWVLTRGVYCAEDAFAKLPVHWMWWPAIGAVAIGVGGWIEPRSLGVGYENIAELLDGTLVGAGVASLLAVKAFVWMTSLGSGTSGGVLAPLLTLGAALGGMEAFAFPMEGVGFWPLVSMAAILGGTMRVPLTAVAFALELTRDLDTTLPVLVAVSAAYLLTALLLPRSILTEKIERRGFHVSREYATDPLEILFVREVMARAVATLTDEATAADAGKLLAATSQTLIPVLTGDGSLIGVVSAEDLEGTPTDGPVARLARPAITARGDDILRAVVYRMAASGKRSLVVMDEEEEKVVGLVTLDDLLAARVRFLDEEQRRERPIDLRQRLGAFFT